MSVLRSKVIQKPYQLFHYYFLSEKLPQNTLPDLEFATDVKLSIERVKNYHWRVQDITHFAFLSSVILFVFFIFPASVLIKLPILAVFCLCFLIPLTSQFFIHALPIFCWLALFFTCGKIPNEWKPAISVKFLPAMETILYGDNLSNVMATVTTSFLDIVAWIPYGLIHFGFPFVAAILIFVFGPPTGLNSFGFAFGYMNLIGVIIQILFPAAPPWYKNLYGLQPADYSMSGSPGGLGRIDDILGFDMYTTAFSNSPVIFGAFPSLHSACAVMDVLFLSWLFPHLQPLWWTYACWLWWSTMYLTHHYFIDLIAGALLAVSVFTYVKYMHLPVRDPTKFCRWSYTEIVKINVTESDPLAFNFNSEYIYNTDADNDVEMSYLNTPYPSVRQDSESRSRQQSRTFLPNLQTTEDDDSSSVEHSAATSVFDDPGQLTSVTSNTSLDDTDRKKRINEINT